MRPIARLVGRKSFSEPEWWTHDRPIWTTFAGGENEQVEYDFAGYVSEAYKRNGVVYACIQARLLVFSEARFQFQSLDGGRAGDLFGNADLALLERPWPNGTTGELLARMEQDASLAGNFFATVVDGRVRRLRPDWVTVVTGSRSGGGPFALDAEVKAYIYEPKAGEHRDPVVLTPDQVCHWSPIPDPDAQWRGMSWLTPVIREVQADTAATRHKAKFFENGAIPSVVVTYDADLSPTAFQAFVEHFRSQHTGVDNAYKTMHLGGGADVTTIGANLQQLDFKATQGAGETRVAAAAGVHPVIVGLSEGLAGSSLNAGNFAAARRRFADGTIRPLWRSAAAALESLVPVPAMARLWYDDRDIPFLQEDQRDRADIEFVRAQTLRQLVEAGFDAESAVAAVNSEDMSLLVHTGRLSVQLQTVGGEDVAGVPAEIVDPALVGAAGVLIRSGFEPQAALAALGLPPISHTGLDPVTLRNDE